MTDTIASPNTEVKAHAPKMVKITIPNKFIGAVIGPSGKVIQEMQKETGTTIVIEEDGDYGVIEILGVEQEKIDAVISDSWKSLEVTIDFLKKNKVPVISLAHGNEIIIKNDKHYKRVKKNVNSRGNIEFGNR